MNAGVRWLARAGLAAALIAGVAACGDDDDDDEASDDTEATEPGGDAAGGGKAAFCDALVGFNGAVMEVEIDETSSEEDVEAAGESLAPLSATIAENAPNDLAETADELNAAVQGLAEGDIEAFDDATFETYTEFVGEAVEKCEFETVEVTGVDYAFEGVPGTIQAGTVAFSFANDSEVEEHEMIIVRRADGVTQSFEELANLPEEESESLVEFAGAAFAPPGESSQTLTELEPGDYAMFCFIPVGGAEDGPPHFVEGMLQEFTVE